MVSEFFVVAQGRLAKSNRRFDNGEIDFLLGDVLASARPASLAWDSAMYFAALLKNFTLCLCLYPTLIFSCTGTSMSSGSVFSILQH